MEESGQVSVDLLLDFLQLCESSGFIELKLPFEDLKSKLNLLWGTIFQGQSGPISPPPCTSHPEEETYLDSSCTCVTNSFSSLPSELSPPSLGLSESHTFGNHGKSVSESFLFDVQTPDLTPNTDLAPQCTEEEETETLALTPNIPVATPHLEGDHRICAEKSTSPPDPIAGSKLQQHNYDHRGVSFPSPNEVCCSNDSPFKELRDEEVSPSHDYSELCLKMEPFDLSRCDKADENSCHTVEEEVTRVDGDPTLDKGASTMEPQTTCSTAMNGNGSVSQPIVVDSDDEEADEKLEKLFVQLKIKSSKKNAPKHTSSRKSLDAFIVSDSEEVESDSDGEGPNENHTPWKVPLATPSYSTPYTRVPFCGSPDLDGSITTTPTTQLYTPKPMCTPLSERNHVYCSTPAAGFRRHIPKPVTTPSANKNFSRHKTEMVQELFELFNSTVFENKLPTDLEIKWNNKLRTTAGYCYNLGFGFSRRARIELSTKVCDSYERIRATLIHEMCHAATWIIDGIKGGHGMQWKAWAQKVSMIHPDLEPVTRCHGYEIAYKHMYKCTRCDHQFGRHSKSVNLQTARCPCCLGTLELLPRLKADGTPVVKKLNRYAQFVKENYATMKLQTPGGSHKDVMETLKTAYYKKDDASTSSTLDRSFSA